MKKKHRIILIVCLVILFLAAAAYIYFNLLPRPIDCTQPRITEEYLQENRPIEWDTLKKWLYITPTKEENREYPEND